MRSEKEFAACHFPGTHNIPILNNQHRHQVGKTYKELGQTEAIELGLDLTRDLKAQLVRRWQTSLQQSHDIGAVLCWRGGLRSKMACQWLEESGIAPLRVSGGYKAMRRHALEVLNERPNFWVLAGYTGSQKTLELAQCRRALDLEALAQHRGSAFGAHLDQEQPVQATFENGLALALSRLAQPEAGALLVEDESRNIGRCFLPAAVHQSVAQSPVIWLDVPLAERVAHIVEAFVLGPTRQGVSQATVQSSFRLAMLQLKPRLGGLLFSRIVAAMDAAFGDGVKMSESSHEGWVKSLLSNYYDKAYAHSFSRYDRKILFRGDRRSLNDFLTHHGYR